MGAFQSIGKFFGKLFRKDDKSKESQIKAKAVKEFMDKQGKDFKAVPRHRRTSGSPWSYTLFGKAKKELPLNLQPIGFGNCRPLKPIAGTRKAKLFEMRKSTREVI